MGPNESDKKPFREAVEIEEVSDAVSIFWRRNTTKDI